MQLEADYLATGHYAQIGEQEGCLPSSGAKMETRINPTFCIP